jgi:hypothetical protein
LACRGRLREGAAGRGEEVPGVGILPHTLLYATTKSRGFTMRRAENGEGETPVTIEEYIGDVFRNHYSSFLLNFDTSDLLTSLEE